eukprot:jgi/Undpi1/11633/HiC_scaffold_35.g13928.m1
MTRSTRSANTPATNKSANVRGGSTSAEESKSSDPPRRSNLNGTPVLHLVTTADLPGSAEGASSAGTASSRIGGSTSPPSTPTQATQPLQDTPSSSTATPAPRAPPSSPSTIRLVRKGKEIAIVRTTPDSQPVPPERDLDYACPRDNCGVALMLKVNSNPKKQDYPVCRRFLSGNCAFSGLRVRYGDKVCWFGAGELIIGECVWAYAIPNIDDANADSDNSDLDSTAGSLHDPSGDDRGAMGTTGETAKDIEIGDNILGFMKGSYMDPNAAEDDGAEEDDDDVDALAWVGGGDGGVFDDFDDFEPAFDYL